MAQDEETGRDYLKHEYNRDGDSYRSPWTNKFYPKCDATFFPSPELLILEQKCNNVFEQYVKLYYDFAISSVFLAETPEPGFNACFLVKKELHDVQQIKDGNWDAIHVVNCTLEAKKANYRVISTVMITMDTQTEGLGQMTMAGSCAKTAEQSVNLPADFHQNGDAFHIRVIGKMIENNESLLRNEVTDNYINRQKAIISSGRLVEEYMSAEQKSKFYAELQAAQAKQ